VADPGVLEQVLLVRGDHGLLPALTGERGDRLDVLPDGDVDVLGRGRIPRLADMLGPEPCLARDERYGRVAEKRLELMLLAGLDRRAKTRMITAFSSVGSAWRGRRPGARGRRLGGP
jgi:hypothetical protein